MIQTDTPQFVAKHRFARITARKARLVADLIRGRTVNEALELLEYAPQRGASFYLKIVRSAVANASLDENVNINRLFISDCRADDGPLLNGRLRFRPGPQGRAMPFAKRLSHLTVRVAELAEDVGEKRVKAPRKSKAAADSTAEQPADAPSAKPAKNSGGKKKA